MSTDNIAAVAISTLSFLVAAISLGWNIYRDVVLKARLRMRFGPRIIITVGSDERPEYLLLGATNHGPGSVKIQMVVLMRASWWRHIFRRTGHAVLIHDYTNPLSGKLPSKLEVGEGIDLLFSYDANCFLSGKWTHIGVTDSFGRTHWAPTQSVRDARAKFREKFPSGQQVAD